METDLTVKEVPEVMGPHRERSCSENIIKRRSTPVIFIEDIESGSSVQMPRSGSAYDITSVKGSTNGIGTTSVMSSSLHGHQQEAEVQDGQASRLLHSRTYSESKLFSPSSEKTSTSITSSPTKNSTTAAAAAASSKQSKRESLKVQKKNYRSQKKQAARELLSTLKDPSVIVLADCLKVRGTLKSWTKLWCVLKPGLLVLYKSQKQKSSHWVGTVLLNTCRLIERPSKKDGFCFKVFHPLDQSIWATKGPKGETIGAIVQPLPYSYLICRASSESAGKCWMDALELSLRCTNLLMRSMKKDCSMVSEELTDDSYLNQSLQPDNSESMNESDCEKHFAEYGLDEDCKTDREEVKTDTDSSVTDDEEDRVFEESKKPVETQYIENTTEELGLQGDSTQTEEVDDENKSIIWALVKQVRPGMDLSKVVLPTFILEPRSFLDKLTDYYCHADFLSEAVLQEDPYTRIKTVTKWYLSGFYKKPKGLKKPYNPIIGETFRCYWHHPKTNSRTFYIAEQISHHPPVSAFHVTNRQDGFNISASILAKSKFYGNSLSAVLDGTAKLTFLKRGEDYYLTMPYAHCKGILIGTLTMEMGGKVTINCPKTGYRCELEFKLKPFLGIGEASNKIAGKFKVGSDTLGTLEGYWDDEIYFKDKTTGESSLFWYPNSEVKARRLKRYTVPIEIQSDIESERLWKNVSDAVITGDMQTATQEKFLLEERQRQEAKERKVNMVQWVPKLFEQDPITGDWVYKYVDMRPWDLSNDIVQYEKDLCIQTWTKHKTPVVRTCSIASLEQTTDTQMLTPTSHIPRPSSKRLKVVRDTGEESGSSTGELDKEPESDYSETGHRKRTPRSGTSSKTRLTEDAFLKALEPLSKLQEETIDHLKSLRGQLVTLNRRQEEIEQQSRLSNSQSWLILAVILAFQFVLQWMLR